MEGAYASNMAVHSVLHVYCLLFIHVVCARVCVI